MTSGDAAPAISAQLNRPTGVALDAAGNFYCGPWKPAHPPCVRFRHHQHFGGEGVQGYSGDGGPATAAHLNYPEAVAVDQAGNVYISDTVCQNSFLYFQLFTFVEPVCLFMSPNVTWKTASSHHVSYEPTQVAALSPEGRLTGEYWHSGHLPFLAPGDLDGDDSAELALGGINNGYHAATLIVLDPDHLSGASAEESNAHQLLGFGTGTERARLIFQRSCINRQSEEYNRVNHLTLRTGFLKVDVGERSDYPESITIYEFDSALALTRLRWSDAFRALHRPI